MARVVRINNPNTSIAAGDTTTATGLIKVAEFVSAADGVYGSGADGDVTISANTTLTSDKFYLNLTVNSNTVLNPGGYRIFVKNNLTMQSNAKIGFTTGSSVSGSISGGGANATAVINSLGGASATQTVTAPAANVGGSNFYTQPWQAIDGFAVSASQTTPQFLRGGAGGASGAGGGVVIISARYVDATASYVTAPGTAGAGGGGGGVILFVSTTDSLPSGITTDVTGGTGCSNGTVTYMQLV
jgi:hypothetical protein